MASNSLLWALIVLLLQSADAFGCDQQLTNPLAMCDVSGLKAALANGASAQCTSNGDKNPLHQLADLYCSLDDCNDVLKVLLEQGVSPNDKQSSQWQSRTPLHVLLKACSSYSAPESRLIDGVILLKLYGADGKITDKSGKSAIALAEQYGYTSVVKVLKAPTCGAGSELTSQGCSKCGKGSVSTGGASTCEPCPSGSIAPGGTNCEACAAPAKPNDDRTECVSPPDHTPVIIGALVGAILFILLVVFVFRRKIGTCCVSTGISNGMMCCVKLGRAMGASEEGAATPEALTNAIKSGNAAMVDDVLTRGVDANAKDSSGCPALITAVLEGGKEKSKMVQALFAKGANVNSTTSTGEHVVSAMIGNLPHDETTMLVEMFMTHGLNMNHQLPGGDSLLLAVLKSCNCKLAHSLLEKGCKIDGQDKNGNTPLHVAAAISDSVILEALLNKGADPTKKNQDDQTPVMSARFAVISKDQRLSANWAFCQKVVIDHKMKCMVTGQMLFPGNEVFVDSLGWCCDAKTNYSPAFPRNHEVAAKLAIKCGDVYNLTDAVEGAWLANQTPPNKAQDEVQKDILAAIMTLVTVLQNELREALKKKDVNGLERGIEMVRYAQVAQMPEEALAIKMLCQLKLEGAMASRSSIELGQALMTARQYEQSDSDVYKQAEQLAKQIHEEEVLAGLKTQLDSAIKKGDFMLLNAAMKAAENNNLKNCTEYKNATAALEKLVSNALSTATKSGSLTRIHYEMQQAKQFKLDHLPAYKAAEDGLTQAIIAALGKAIADKDTDALQGAINDAEKYNRSHLPEVDKGRKELKNMPREQCLKMLKDATRSGKETDLALAIQYAIQKPEVKDLNMRTTDEFKQAVDAYRKAKAIPQNWDNEAIVDNAVEGKTPLLITSANKMVNAFQILFDMTNRSVRTRDRRGDVPKRLEVKAVEHVQNGSNYIDYMRRRENIRKLVKDKGNPYKVSDINQPNVCKTFAKFGSGKQFHNIWQELEGLPDCPIDPSINEYYLFHGTKPEAATAIAKSDFRVDLAGSNAGTLYGRGIYFGESCSKSDEYGAEATSGERIGLSPMLVCRVVCGRINYQDGVYPDTDAIVQSCTKGEYHCCLGDREKCRGTFREFIVYDNDQAYPEFIVWYKRVF